MADGLYLTVDSRLVQVQSYCPRVQASGSLFTVLNPGSLSGDIDRNLTTLISITSVEPAESEDGVIVKPFVLAVIRGLILIVVKIVY